MFMKSSGQPFILRPGKPELSKFLTELENTFLSTNKARNKNENVFSIRKRLSFTQRILNFRGKYYTE